MVAFSFRLFLRMKNCCRFAIEEEVTAALRCVDLLVAHETALAAPQTKSIADAAKTPAAFIVDACGRILLILLCAEKRPHGGTAQLVGRSRGRQHPRMRPEIRTPATV